MPQNIPSAARTVAFATNATDWLNGKAEKPSENQRENPGIPHQKKLEVALSETVTKR